MCVGCQCVLCHMLVCAFAHNVTCYGVCDHTQGVDVRWRKAEGEAVHLQGKAGGKACTE